MNSVDCASPTGPGLARIHIAPRPHMPGHETTRFFAHFSPDGKVLVLQTPTTQETYSAEPAAGDDGNRATTP